MDSTVDTSKPAALALLSSSRPRNLGWSKAGALLFGDWGTSRLYVLGMAFAFAGGTSLFLIAGMSVLILAVGWAYTQICRIYPDGGGVYSAAKRTSSLLAVVGALLLFADYVVTASLSSLDAFHYFGLHGDGSLWAWNAPGLWAIVAIVGIGIFNLMGPKHTSSFALGAAAAMVVITLLITAFAIPQIDWHLAWTNALKGDHHFGHLWMSFVAIILALSGVEAIGNLTGVMIKPVAKTARKAIWVVALEVAVFNLILGFAMVAALGAQAGDEHKADMLAFLAKHYAGDWAEYMVRIIGGLLLLSAVNTVITDMISVQYLLSRDSELPSPLQRLNRFGVPWVPAVLAIVVPVVVLLVSHDLDSLADLYAMGVVGAVAINISLVTFHPRLRAPWRKVLAGGISLMLIAIWVSLGFHKWHALVFVCVVVGTGLLGRLVTKRLVARAPKPSLLRQAIHEQLKPEAMMMPKVLVGTYGSDTLAVPAMREAKAQNALLVVCFIREVQLSYKYDQQLTIDSDPAAIKAFARYLDVAHAEGVQILPCYDSGPDAAVLLAENAALYGCTHVLIGTSRQNALYHLIKGHFQQRLEAMLPPDLQVNVIAPVGSAKPAAVAASVQ